MRAVCPCTCMYMYAAFPLRTVEKDKDAVLETIIRKTRTIMYCFEAMLGIALKCLSYNPPSPQAPAMPVYCVFS